MDEIKFLFASVMQVSPTQITESSTSDEIASWTSLNHLNLIAAFEEKFDINIEPEEISIMAESFGCFQEVIIKKIKTSI